MMVEQPRVNVAHSPSVGQQDLDLVKETRDYKIIISRNIFQAALEAGEPGSLVAADDDLDETSLQLVLLGTVTGNKDDARAIIIDEKGKRQDLFRIGDSLQGATITRISRGKVVLEVNGRSEVLNIRDRKGGGSVRSVTSTQSNLEQPVVRRPIPAATPRRRISLREPLKRQQTDIQEPEEPLTDEAIDAEIDGSQEDGT